MKEILITFLTKKGECAYRSIEAEGKAQSYMDRKIANSVAKDFVISKDPLVVRVKIKIERLAVRVEMDKQIIEALTKKGVRRDVDYTMKVS